MCHSRRYFTYLSYHVVVDNLSVFSLRPRGKIIALDRIQSLRQNIPFLTNCYKIFTVVCQNGKKRGRETKSASSHFQVIINS